MTNPNFCNGCAATSSSANFTSNSLCRFSQLISTIKKFPHKILRRYSDRDLSDALKKPSNFMWSCAYLPLGGLPVYNVPVCPYIGDWTLIQLEQKTGSDCLGPRSCRSGTVRLSVFNWRRLPWPFNRLTSPIKRKPGFYLGLDCQHFSQPVPTLDRTVSDLQAVLEFSNTCNCHLCWWTRLGIWNELDFNHRFSFFHIK